jgi:hypothetical protein
MSKMSEEIGVPIENAVEEINMLLEKFKWFSNAEVFGTNIVVYVHYLDKDVMHYVPIHCYGHNVKIYYVAYAECRERFCKPITLEALREMN